MKLTHSIKFILATVFMLVMSQSVAVEQVHEEAIEGAPDVFFLGKNMNGSIHGKICGNCPVVKLTITPKSKAFLDNKRVDLQSMSKSASKPYLTFFDIKTKNVTRMYWESK